MTITYNVMRFGMKQDIWDEGSLSEDEKRLITFYRSQNQRVKNILVNITYFEPKDDDITCPEGE